MYDISIKMGLWMLAGFISFFLLMYILGFGQHIELHIFYLIIQIFCMYRAIRAYYALHPFGLGLCIAANAFGLGFK